MMTKGACGQNTAKKTRKRERNGNERCQQTDKGR